MRGLDVLDGARAELKSRKTAFILTFNIVSGTHLWLWRTRLSENMLITDTFSTTGFGTLLWILGIVYLMGQKCEYHGKLYADNARMSSGFLPVFFLKFILNLYIPRVYPQIQKRLPIGIVV